ALVDDADVAIRRTALRGGVQGELSDRFHRRFIIEDSTKTRNLDDPSGVRNIAMKPGWQFRVLKALIAIATIPIVTLLGLRIAVIADGKRADHLLQEVRTLEQRQPSQPEIEAFYERHRSN